MKAKATKRMSWTRTIRSKQRMREMTMRNVWTIFKRELRSYFVSPVAYIIGGLFLILAGLFFVLPFFFSSNEATLRNWAGTVVVFLLFLAPMFTMRLVAEEKQSGTIELLLTSPIRDWEMITG